MDDDTPIENRIVTKSLMGAQVKVEGHHFEIRKQLLDYDDVLNNPAPDHIRGTTQGTDRRSPERQYLDYDR